MAVCPEIDPASPLQFVINAAAGSRDADMKREVIEAALRTGGRRGDLLFSRPAGLARVAQEAATQASATRTAVVAVGGDGTLNTVAQAAHAAGCAMGVVPQGTFNYFARTHGIPADPADAVRLLLLSAPAPVQVAGINDRVFLVNASLGLYPDLLEDREAYKARFGRSRWVAFVAACATLLRAQRRLRLHIEMGSTVRDGILRTENMLLEGDVFSIQGKGSCNLQTEALDVVVRANLFKQKTLAGKITHFVTMPFTLLVSFPSMSPLSTVGLANQSRASSSVSVPSKPPYTCTPGRSRKARVRSVVSVG